MRLAAGLGGLLVGRRFRCCASGAHFMVYTFGCEDSPLKYLNLPCLFWLINLETEWLAGWFV